MRDVFYADGDRRLGDFGGWGNISMFTQCQYCFGVWHDDELFCSPYDLFCPVCGENENLSILHECEDEDKKIFKRRVYYRAKAILQGRTIKQAAGDLKYAYTAHPTKMVNEENKRIDRIQEEKRAARIAEYQSRTKPTPRESEQDKAARIASGIAAIKAVRENKNKGAIVMGWLE